MIASALIGGGINLLGSFLGSSDAATQNKELMQQQYQYSRDLMKYQNELNSPGTYLQQLKDANLSPALMYSKGANQLSTGLGSTPSGDLSGAVQNKALLAQIANTSADTALKLATAKKTEKEAEKTSVETEGLMTDNQFKAALHSKNLEYMDSEVQEKLSQANLNEEEAKVARQTYENLVKTLDQIEAQTEVYRETANKIGEEAALLRVEQAIRQKLADSQLRVNEQQIRTMASQAYEAMMSGDSAKIDAANKSLQGEILAIQAKEAPKRESLITKNMQQQSQQETYKTRYEKAKAEHSESLATEAAITAGRHKSTAWIYRYTPFAYTREILEAAGSALGGSGAAVIKAGK